MSHIDNLWNIYKHLLQLVHWYQIKLILENDSLFFTKNKKNEKPITLQIVLNIVSHTECINFYLFNRCPKICVCIRSG